MKSQPLQVLKLSSRDSSISGRSANQQLKDQLLAYKYSSGADQKAEQNGHHHRDENRKLVDDEKVNSVSPKSSPSGDQHQNQSRNKRQRCQSGSLMANQLSAHQ